MLKFEGEDFQNLDEADSIDMNNLFLGDGDNSQVNDQFLNDDHDISEIFDQKNTANFINLDDEQHHFI